MAGTATWNASELPFAIDYSPQTLDEIRMSVSDAFYSVPRGGVEIGGILLGKWTGERLDITGYKQIDCEHAFGPSFTLSPRDRIALGRLIASEQALGAQVAGWYHSHTRSEIELSPADLEIYRGFFPEPWQVALVLRPHTFLPMRAGIFFRDAEGLVRSEAPHKEFTLEPLNGKVAAVAASGSTASSITDKEPAPSPSLTAPAPRRDTPVPRFLERKEPAARVWPRIVIPVLIGAGIGAPAYWLRDLWVPRLMAVLNSAHMVTAPAPGLGLNVIALDGQLEVRWDRNSAMVTGSPGGVLRVTGEGSSTGEVWLDHQHLLSGAITVANPSERVDISLAVNQPGGPPVSEATSFLGKLPQAGEASAGNSGVIAKLRADLDDEIERNRKLQKDVDFLAKQWREMQRNSR